MDVGSRTVEVQQLVVNSVEDCYAAFLSPNMVWVLRAGSLGFRPRFRVKDPSNSPSGVGRDN